MGVAIRKCTHGRIGPFIFLIFSVKFRPMMKKPVSLRDGILWSLVAVILLAAGSPLLQAQEDPLRTLYFPDYVDGGGWSVQLAVSNIDTTTAAAVIVAASDQEGQPIPGFFDFDDPFEIPPLGTRVFTSAGAGELRRGWIEVRTDTESVRGLLTYRHSETGLEVSVESVELGDHFALFVEESSGIGTGVAIFKPDPSSTIEFRIYGEDGINPLGEGLARVRNFNQDALTIPQWFDADGINTEFLQDFRGILLLRSEDGSLFAPIGIRFGQRGESLSSVPVIRVTGEDGIDDGDMPSTLAPADEAAFNTLVVGQRVATNFPTVYVDFVSPGRFRENQGTETYTGSYTYRNTGSDTGTVTFNYDDGDRCTASLTFDSTTSGTATSMCDDGFNLDYNWRLVEIPASNTPDSGDALTGEITECSGIRTAPGSILATIRGTVQAHRSVSSVYVTGTVNDQLVRRVPLGSISAGESENFTIIGTINTLATSLRCKASIEWTVLQ